ncbi:MAG: glycosyltransferase [Fodinibius sp.]|nr:glycosyltransferase [Fodinibius sp.]
MDFPKIKIRVLKLGMNLDDIHFEQRQSAGPNLMMIGRMVEKKGFKYAIRAVATLKNNGTNVQLDLYGDGILREELEELAEQLEVTGNVTFYGQTDNDIVFDELYKHDILLVPSVQAKDGDREGIPQTAVEGMATGIPVIASDHAGLPELVDDEKTGSARPNAMLKRWQTLLNNIVRPKTNSCRQQKWTRTR